ncbi:hypothetical protein JOB18_044820 [Solea senegalensis]|uniref:Transmembrane protein n=1 Tax=Solea senegalensis TaxID=28829 RepID=A0AAV6QZI7_SOLSE|nr:hypothetical protein JOB18_044820 [Solea senegalensis]
MRVKRGGECREKTSGGRRDNNNTQREREREGSRNGQGRRRLRNAFSAPSIRRCFSFFSLVVTYNFLVWTSADKEFPTEIPGKRPR